MTAAAIAACGSAGSGGVSGPAVFATHCSACHSISGAYSPRKQGGDLKNLRLPQRDLIQYAREMPVIHGHLTPGELRAVVGYVQSVERR